MSFSITISIPADYFLKHCFRLAEKSKTSKFFWIDDVWVTGTLGKYHAAQALQV
jgi:hypothetical protein